MVKWFKFWREMKNEFNLTTKDWIDVKGDITQLKADVGTLTKTLDEVASNVRDTRKSLQDLVDGLPAVRKDVNYANGEILELKEETKVMREKLQDMHDFKVRLQTTITVFKYLVGVLGLSNIAAILAFLLKP